MPTVDLALDLDAPILPGVGAAGLRVGTRLSELPLGLLEGFSVERRVNPCLPNAVLTLYRSAAVTLYVTNRLIDQIAVAGAYRGALHGPSGSVDLGATVAAIEAPGERSSAAPAAPHADLRPSLLAALTPASSPYSPQPTPDAPLAIFASSVYAVYSHHLSP
jgi:hypothetical protein